MKIRNLIVMSALCVSPFAAFAQNADGSAAGGSAGDGDKPTTYTRIDFAQYDKNRDGILDKKELATAKLDGSLIKKIDTNGDGSISEAEFDAYQHMTEGNNVPKMPKK